MSLLEAGGVWRHSKGGTYLRLGVATQLDLADEEDWTDLQIQAVNSEKPDQFVKIGLMKDGTFQFLLLNGPEMKGEWIAYMSIVRSVWFIRPKHMWNEPVAKGGVRFTLIAESS